MKKVFVVFTVCLILWFVLLLLINSNKMASDGFFELGYPFVFYRDFSGKGNYDELGLGLSYKNLLIDLGILFLIAVGLSKLIFLLRKTKAPN